MSLTNVRFLHVLLCLRLVVWHMNLQVQTNGTAALQRMDARFAALEAAVDTLTTQVMLQTSAYSAELQAGFSKLASLSEVGCV